ncbi:hypothetical protein ACHAXS_012433 [Conticribra weissflogii]
MNHSYPDVNSRPFRSMLYVPASNTRALEKLSKFTSAMKPDSVMYDLEDGVGPASKDEARDNLGHFFRDKKKSGDYPSHFGLVRVNRMDTPWFENDTAAVVEFFKEDFDNELVHGVILPKIEGWDDVNAASKHFQDLFGETSSSSPSKDFSHSNPTATPPIISPIPFWAMMETPQAILSASSIASHPSIQGLILGTNDLSKEIQLRPHSHKATRSGLTTSLQLTILAARAHDKLVIDGVYNHFNDDKGFREECNQGKEWGMDGKTLIHPNQLSAANEIFAPSDEEIEYARRVLDCWEEASSKSNEKFTGVAVLNGLMIEELHVQSARKLLERADSISSFECA